MSKGSSLVWKLPMRNPRGVEGGTVRHYAEIVWKPPMRNLSRTRVHM